MANNNNNNNSHDNVYGAVIMTKVIARVHPVHLMNVDWAPGGRQPSDQASRLGLWVRRKLAATVHIHRRHCYYSSARKLALILPPRHRHCSRGAQPVPKAVYHSSCRDKHNRPQCNSNLGPLTPQSDALTTRLLWPLNVNNKRRPSLEVTPTTWSTTVASWLSVTHSYTAANRRAEYCDERVCLSVRGCVFASPWSYIRNYPSDLHQIFCECYLRPWLGPALAA